MSRSFSVAGSRVMPYEAMKRHVMYSHHMVKLASARPTIDTKSQASKSFSVERPWKLDYSKVLSQRKILNDEILEGKRQRDLYRKRRDEFEKRFNAAVGYRNPIQTTLVRKAIEREKKIIKENVQLMRKLKEVKTKETLNSSISSAKTALPKYAGMSSRAVYLGGYDMTDVRKQYQPYLITKVDLPKIKNTYINKPKPSLDPKGSWTRTPLTTAFAKRSKTVQPTPVRFSSISKTAISKARTNAPLRQRFDMTRASTREGEGSRPTYYRPSYNKQAKTFT